MPTFPKYRGELPQCLNPWNLRHYWLLAYWVYFRPTALHCYLYEAAPEEYQQRGWSKIRRTWHIPAYRSLYLMAPVAVLLFALLLGLLLGIWLLWTLQSHTASVNALAVTPDGKQVVSASDDNTLKVWELKTGKLQQTLNGHTNGVSAVAVTPDGKQVVSASFDNTLKVWELKTGKLQQTLKGHIYGVSAVAVTPDGKQVVSASDDNTLKVWDLKTGKLQQTLSGHTESVNAVAVTPEGKQVVSGSWDNTLKVWDITTGQLQYSFGGNDDFVRVLAVTPDGKQVVSASRDNTLEVWDITTGEVQQTLTGHTDSVYAAAVTPDGKQVVSGSWDNTLKVWELKTGKLQQTLNGHTSLVYAVAVTPDGKQVVSGSWDNTLKVWDIKTGTAVPLSWTQLRLLVLGLAAMMLCSLAIINAIVVFPVILALSAITFSLVGRSITGLLSSALFSCGLGALVSPVFYVVEISNELIQLNTLGFPKPFPFHTLFLITFYIVSSIAFGILLSISLTNINRRTFAVLGSVVAILLIGVVAGLAFGVFSAVQLRREQIIDIFENRKIFATGPARTIHPGLRIGIPIARSTYVFALFVLLGNSRLIFYPIQLPLALRRKHPALWDELTVLPLPKTRRLLSQHLQQNETAGLELVSDIVRNPYQRWTAQQALQTYLHKQPAPLHLLYKLLADPAFNTYYVAPISKQDWQRIPTTGKLLMGELAGKWVNCSPAWYERLSDRLLWYLTRFRRDRRQTPLTRFAGMLYQLLDADFVNLEVFYLGNYRNIYARLSNYPAGVEIEQSFEAMASFLSYRRFSELPAAIDAKIADTTAIRPTVITSLHRLQNIASEVATYLAASSKVNQLAALARATDALKTLDEYISTEVAAPEQTILHRIIQQWSKLIIAEGGIAGRNQIFEPVANPYVVGNPVKNHLFIGREDTLRRLEELWMVTGQPPSVVLYGHRRMGKSSILRNLGASLGSQVTVIDFNMQRVGFVDNTGELLYNLALALYNGVSPAQQVQLGEPDEEKFLTRNPYTSLDRFLKQLDQVRNGQRFIIAIDEFELIEEAIKKHELEPRLLDFLRSLIQTYSWFVLAFAGLHSLQEMTENYWNPLFGSVTAIPVSFLSPKAATQLITQPSPDFNLDYDKDAINEIIQLTGGQPYLIQLIGHTLVTRFNRQTYEEGIERERRFTLADVQFIINTPEFYRDGNAYFNGVWVQAEMSQPQHQTAVLQALSHASLSLTEIIEQTALTSHQVEAALSTLEDHDVVMLQDEKYVYTVELMRRWVMSLDCN